MGTDSEIGVGILQIDEIYEFCAPRFFDFTIEENEDEIKEAELWFEISQSYAPSPFMPKIREGRSVQINGLCNFENVEQNQEESVHVSAHGNNKKDDSTTAAEKIRDGKDSIVVAETVINDEKNSSEMKPCIDNNLLQEEKSLSVDIPSSMVSKDRSCNETSYMEQTLDLSATAVKPHACTPKSHKVPPKVTTAPNSSKSRSAKKIASIIRQTSSSKGKDKTPCAQAVKITKPKGVIKCPISTNTKNNAIAIGIAQENHAIKRQKLDGGKARKILNVKTRVLPHKSKPESFISTAELVKKFQSNTRDIDISQKKSASHETAASMIQRRPKLKLTRPKEPEFVTAQRTRAVRVKSSAELEEEMLAKIPKFKARPVNKKILEAPTLSIVPRSTPQPPVFKEFQLRTMERANQHAESSSVVSSIDMSSQNQNKSIKLSEPRPPCLETTLRARPSKIKSSQELELEELEKIPKFKARPINKKILESKGNLGLVCNSIPQITVPCEFYFATDDRLGPSFAVADMFDKLSLHSDSSSRHEYEIPRLTTPNPFHLHTEERGVEKGRQLENEILQKQLEEERARIRKANPYPYTTDYPVIPPKPEPKQCTKPETFQLESLIRHEEELHRKMEDKERMEREEAQRRLYKAQPILKDDPMPLPKIERKPLTDVQEFKLHVNHRAVERSKFDKKIKEKEIIYKRMRDDNESAKTLEEEKELKQIRRELVPHALPLPNFNNPFHPKKSTKDPTKAKSPILRVKHRGEMRKHAYLR